MLPIDRTNKAALDTNLVNGLTSDAPKLKANNDTLYNSFDELFNYAAGLVQSDKLSAMGIINVKDYKASGSAQTTTGSITAGQSTLILATALDFKNGQGISVANGVAEVASLKVTAAATASGNVTVTLNGQDFLAAVANADTIIQVATKIRAAAFAGWTAGGTAGTDTITFTCNSHGLKTDAVYSAGTTGVTGTMTTTTQGTADMVTTILSGAGTTSLVLAANATATASNVTAAHNDRVGLQAAIDSFGAVDGGEIKLPEGSYYIDSALISLYRRKFFGPGKIICSDGYNDSVFGGMLTIGAASGTGSTVSRSVIEGISFLGNGKYTFGVYLYGSGEHEVSRCFFTNMQKSGIGGATATTDCVVTGNNVQGLGDYNNSAILMLGSRSKVIDNIIKLCISKGVSIGGTGSIAIGNTIVYDNATSANTADGIYLAYSSNHCLVDGNTIQDAKGNGIKSTSTTSYHSICSNVITMSSSCVGAGIFLQGASRCTVEGNTIVMQNKYPGIYVTKHPNAEYPLSEADSNVVSHNVLYGTILSDTTNPNIEFNSGIIVFDSAYDNILSDNNIENFTLAICVSFADRTIMHDNKAKSCVNGADVRVSVKCKISDEHFTTTGKTVNIRSGCHKLKVNDNYLETASIGCYTQASAQENVCFQGNTAVYTGTDAVSFVVYFDAPKNLNCTGNIVICPTTVTQSMYVDTPAYGLIVGNTVSGKTLNVATPDSFTVNANNIPLAPYLV